MKTIICFFKGHVVPLLPVSWETSFDTLVWFRCERCKRFKKGPAHG